MKLHLYLLVLAMSFTTISIHAQSEYSFLSETTLEPDTFNNDDTFIKVIDFLIDDSCENVDLDQSGCPRCCVCCEYRCEYCNECGHCTSCCCCYEPGSFIEVIITLIGGLIALLVQDY